MFTLIEKYNNGLRIVFTLCLFFSMIITFSLPVIKQFDNGEADSVISNYINDSDDGSAEKESKKELTQEIEGDYFDHYMNLSCGGNTAIDLIFPLIVQHGCAMDFDIKSPPPKS